jgi:hypothetical protein
MREIMLQTFIKNLQLGLTSSSDETGGKGYLLSLALEGFADIRQWLLGSGPVPDPRRIDEMIRLPDGITSANRLLFAKVLYGLVLCCVAKRYSDRTGQQLPPENTARWFCDIFEADPVSAWWDWNGGLLLSSIEGQDSERFDETELLTFRGRRGSFLSLRTPGPNVSF